MREYNIKNRKTSSAFRGVSWLPHRKKWQARSTFDGKQKYLGLYDTEAEAAKRVEYYRMWAERNRVQMNVLKKF